MVNHHGAVDNAEFRQHGGRGQIAVLDVDDLLAPRNDGTAIALRRHTSLDPFRHTRRPVCRYAVISRGPSSPPFSQELGHLYVIDLRSRSVVATVTGVGHEPCALAIVEK